MSKPARRQGLGGVLCQLCEDVVRVYWGKKYIYLHVEKNNLAAQELYVGRGGCVVV